MSIEIRPHTADVLRAAMDGGEKNVGDLCELMAMEAANLSPRDTGFNAGSIATDIKRAGKKMFGRVFTQSSYGGWLEIGTSRMPARPYFLNAYRWAKGRLRNA